MTGSRPIPSAPPPAKMDGGQAKQALRAMTTHGTLARIERQVHLQGHLLQPFCIGMAELRK